MSTTEDPASFSFSDLLGIPTLLFDAAPLSRFWNLPVLLSDSASFLSFESLSNRYTFGVPKLLDNGAAFSDELRIPVLWKSKAKN